MRISMIIAALLATAPALAKTENPSGGEPSIAEVFGDGWEMKPEEAVCTLTHRNNHSRPDLMITSRRTTDEVAVGLILVPGAPYRSPIRLTVMAQTDVAEQIGRVTFTPHHSHAVAMLTAIWPIANLLPRLASVDRLDFYAPGNRLVHSVLTTGSAAPVASFQRCLVSIEATLANATAALELPAEPPPPPAPAEPQAAKAAWIPIRDLGGCSIVQTTQKGNELGFVFNRRDNLMMMLRLRKGPVIALGKTNVLTLVFWRTTEQGRTVAETEDAATVILHARLAGRNQLIYGRVDPGFLDKLAQGRWSLLGLNPLGDDNIDPNLSEQVSVTGSGTAVAELRRCARELPE